MKCRNITFGCRERYAARWKEGNADEKDDTRYDRSARSLLLELRQIAPFFNVGAIEITMYDSIFTSYYRYFPPLLVCILQREKLKATIFTCPIHK